MAGSQITIALNQLEKQRYGFQAISLTNFDADTEPEIASGSKCEIGGALYEFSAGESITGWGGIGVSNDVYIKLTVSGTSVTASWTTTAPTWSESKQGWYDSLERYIGGCYKDASGNYSYKWLYSDRPGVTGGGNYDVGNIVPCIFKFKPGYLYCDGSTISSTTNPEYTRLVYELKKEAAGAGAHPYYHADADKAVLPNLQGAAIRGIDAAATRDSDGERDSGDYQADLVINHVHDITHDHDIYHSGGAGADFVLDRSNNQLQTAASGLVVTHSGNSGNPTANNSTENIMKNVALYYLIKY